MSETNLQTSPREINPNTPHISIHAYSHGALEQQVGYAYDLNVATTLAAAWLTARQVIQPETETGVALVDSDDNLILACVGWE